MKELRQDLKMKNLILTHGDSDGICAGAIAKSAYPDSYVYFTSPVNLLEKLDYVKGFDTVIICDIAVNERNCEELYTRLDELAAESELYYIDHHPLPEKCWKADWLYHETGPCASELTFRVFEGHLNREMQRVAIYGAIGDFCDNTEHINRWVRAWDKRGLYFQAGTLVEAILQMGKDYAFKRTLLGPLSKNQIPSEVQNLCRLAREAALNEEKIRLFAKENFIALKNCAYIVNPNNSISKAAIYAAFYGKKEVGIAAEYRPKKKAYDLSIRSQGKVDINLVLRALAPRFGGSGGGHPSAAGARIPSGSFERFLEAFDAALEKQERTI